MINILFWAFELRGQLHTQQLQARAKIYAPISFALNETRSEGGRNPCEGEDEGDIHARSGRLARVGRARRGAEVRK